MFPLTFSLWQQQPFEFFCIDSTGASSTACRALLQSERGLDGNLLRFCSTLDNGQLEFLSDPL
jgi:hypothetical protein